MRRWWPVLVPVLALVVLFGYGAWNGWSRTEVVKWDESSFGYHDNIVELSYVGSDCRQSVSAAVDETDERVKITLTETVRARSCSDVGVIYHVEVPLDRPVGDRQIVDGACQSDAWADRPACQERELVITVE